MTTVANDIFENLLKNSENNIPAVDEVVRASIIQISKKEARFNLPGFRTGIIRGREIMRDPRFVSTLKVGDEVNVRVLDLDNETGEAELGFADFGENRAWEKLNELRDSGEIIEVAVSDANKGGLIITLENIAGFMPVSQLRPENYPRVSGGDKNKILEKLKSLVGKKMKVKILTADPEENKLIFSEKVVWEDEFKGEVAKYKAGDVIEGQISALTDFGAFIKFDNMEGLIHISEIVWQRLNHPADVLKVGETVKAKILEVAGSKIFLSIKRLTEDPWKNIGDKFKVGDVVKGKVVKVSPFGFIVELTPEIFGLAHISELSDEQVTNPSKIAALGDTLEFKIVSVEPDYHKLNLSLKALKEKTEEQRNTETEKRENIETEEQRNPVGEQAPYGAGTETEKQRNIETEKRENIGTEKSLSSDEIGAGTPVPRPQAGMAVPRLSAGMAAEGLATEGLATEGLGAEEQRNKETEEQPVAPPVSPESDEGEKTE